MRGVQGGDVVGQLGRQRRCQIIQISSREGQVAFPGTRCTTLRRLVSRVVESVAQEVAPFGTGSTIVEPGGARTEFRYGSPRSPSLCPSTTDAPAHSFLEMLDAASGLAPGDPARIAARIIDSVDVEQATLRARIADFEVQRELAASTDFPPTE